MFVPIGDENPLRYIRFQYVTVALIAVNILVFLLEQSPAATDAVVASFSVVPNELFQVGLTGGPAPVSGDQWQVAEPTTLLTYMFLHGDILHIGSNMLFLWVFGDNVEDAMGHARYLFFYLACGVVAALLHSIVMPESADGLIGASGAVSGVIAAYLMLHPRVSVWVLALKIIPLKITAAWVLGLWIATQVLMILAPETGPVAWWAHIGGLLAGAALLPMLKRPNVRLFAP